MLLFLGILMLGIGCFLGVAFDRCGKKKGTTYSSIRNYEASEGLSLLFKLLAEDPTAKITKQETYHLTVESDTLIVRVWNANKWYAWLSDGRVTYKDTGRTSAWYSSMPDDESMELFYQRFKTEIL